MISLQPRLPRLLARFFAPVSAPHSYRARFFVACGLVSACVFASPAQALELDWSGQFWSEYHMIADYTMNPPGGGALDNARAKAGGYYIPEGGSNLAHLQTVFLRLRPKIIVNDNIAIKTEWWVGDPVFGMFGNALPYSPDQSWYSSSQSRGSLITAQRFWSELITDFGVVQIGRVPLHWGLGIVWNAGENLWDRYMSTGDAVRWIAKFGSFSLMPSFIVNSAGINIGGNAQVLPSGSAIINNLDSFGSVQDFSLILKYENEDDQLEGGLNFIKRWIGSGQDPTYRAALPVGLQGSSNFSIFDFYARKKMQAWKISAELPFTLGNLGSAQYNSLGLATEVSYTPNDTWNWLMKGGFASGQANDSKATPDQYDAFYFNPNYHIAMIMFNYQLANFAAPQTLNNPNLAPNQLASPFNNPIVNAVYLSLGTEIKPNDKWTLRPNLVYAYAPIAASQGSYFLNTWSRQMVEQKTTTNQGHHLGVELDLGVSFQWDENFLFAWDNGFFLPGNYYAFSNTDMPNLTSLVFATAFRVGISF